MNIDQPPGNASQLEDRVIVNDVDVKTANFGWKTYKLEPVHIRVCFHKLVYAPICHPFRHHCKLSLGHHHPY